MLSPWPASVSAACSAIDLNRSLLAGLFGLLDFIALGIEELDRFVWD
jgi:hypothetical protein